jgi:ketosteroid isomerase-like protein
MSTRSIIDEYFHRLAQKSDWSACLADDMVFTSFTTPNKRVDGRAAYLESTKRFYSTIVAVTVKDLVVDGAKACALTHYDLQAPGLPAFSTDVAEVFQVRDGKIASFDIYFDSAPFPKQPQ